LRIKTKNPTKDQEYPSSFNAEVSKIIIQKLNRDRNWEENLTFQSQKQEIMKYCPWFGQNSATRLRIPNFN